MEMGEMPKAEGLQASRAEFRPARVESDMQSGAESNETLESPQETIDMEKKRRAMKYANEISELRDNLERAKKDASEAGSLAPTFEKVIKFFEAEIDKKEKEFAGEAGTDISQ